MPGPAAKPTALKVLEGNPGKQRLPKNEPKPRPLRPAKPDFGTDRRASAHWDRLVPILESMCVLTEADGDVLKLLCLELSIVDTCSETWDGGALIYETCNGSQAPVAVLKMRRDAAKAAESLMARLGLSPADRTKIEVRKPDGESNPLADILAEAKAEAAARRKKSR